MYPSPYMPFNTTYRSLSAFDYYIPQLLQMYKGLETTNYDGRPFLNPFNLPVNPFNYSINQLNTTNKSEKSLKKEKKTPKVKKVVQIQSQQDNLGKRGLDKLSKKKSKEFSAETEKIEKIESLKKKVFVADTNKKPQTIDEVSNVSTICVSSPNKSDLSNNEQPINKPVSLANKLDMPKPIKKAPVNEPELIIIDEERKLKNVVQTAFNSNTGDLTFKVEYETESKRDGYAVLSREDLLKEDPKLLVYFYEKCLKFHKSSGFSSEDLEKI